MPWEEAQWALSSLSAVFKVQTWAIGLNRQKNWGRGTKVCIVKQSQSQVWFCCLMTGGARGQQSWSGRWSGPDLGSYHLERVNWFLFERILGIIVLTGRVAAAHGSSSLSWRCYQFFPFWNPRWLQSDWKENGLQQRQTQNGGRDAKLLLFLVNLWDQVRSQCFSARATWVPLTITSIIFCGPELGSNPGSCWVMLRVFCFVLFFSPPHSLLGIELRVFCSTTRAISQAWVIILFSGDHVHLWWVIELELP
jgi:hypothetical protein